MNKETRRAIVHACLGAILACQVTGCANVNSIYRTFDSSKSSVSIDVKQRVVLSNGNVVCAEPSPDALSAFANSAGISAGNGAGKVAQAALSASESASFTGLRTQTIQLLRDGMYRICEGYMGGALTKDQFSTLQRRFQNLMMGLLAIEQLTGAVTPHPVALTTNAQSGTGGDTQKEQANLETAQKSKVDADADVSAAQKAVDDQQSVVTAALQNQKTVNAKKDPSATADDIAQADSQVKDARKTKDSLDNDLNRKKGLAMIAAASVQSARAALDVAQLRVSSAAAGSFATGSDSGKMDPVTSEKVATAVQSIVTEVISTSFMQDACISFLDGSSASNSTSKSNADVFTGPQRQVFAGVCLDVIKNSAALYQNQLKSLLKNQ